MIHPTSPDRDFAMGPPESEVRSIEPKIVATRSVCSPPPCGRAIAYGKVAPILHLAGWIGSERQLSRSALDSVLFWVRFGGRVSTARRLALDPGEYNKGKAICDSPTPCGEGLGVGVAVRTRWHVRKGRAASPGEARSSDRAAVAPPRHSLRVVPMQSQRALLWNVDCALEDFSAQ
jgi:hypothetical protein